MSLRQRFNDWKRERRIKRLASAMKGAGGAVEILLWVHLQAEILARSPEQVARMERKQGIEGQG